jgi:hypothetical protein
MFKREFWGNWEPTTRGCWDWSVVLEGEPGKEWHTGEEKGSMREAPLRMLLTSHQLLRIREIYPKSN